jgi:hypothetical protein
MRILEDIIIHIDSDRVSSRTVGDPFYFWIILFYERIWDIFGCKEVEMDGGRDGCFVCL